MEDGPEVGAIQDIKGRKSDGRRARDDSSLPRFELLSTGMNGENSSAGFDSY